MFRQRLLLVCFIFLISGSPQAALNDPGCDALAAWATATDAQESAELEPGYPITHVAQDERIEPLFGLPLGQWQRAERKQFAKLIGRCRKQAARQRKRELSKQLSQAQNSVNRALGMHARLNKARQREQQRIERERQREQRAVAMAQQRSAQMRRKAEYLLDQLGALPPGEERDQTYADALLILDGQEPPDRGYRNRRASDLLYNFKGAVASLQDEDQSLLRQQVIDTRRQKVVEGEQQLKAMREELAAAKEELATLQPDQAGYARINELNALPILSQLPQQEAQDFRRQVQMRRRQWTTEKQRQRQQLAQAAQENLLQVIDGFEVKALPDLGRYVAAYQQALGKQKAADANYYQQVSRLRSRFQQRFAKERDRLLPAFERVLAQVPETSAGLQQLNRIALEKTGVDRRYESLLKPYHQAALVRATAIRKKQRRVACYHSLEQAGINAEDAGRALWVGEKTTLGTFICAAVKQGHRLVAYEGAGILSSSHELRFTGKSGETLIRLHPQQVTGQAEDMLVGFEMEQSGKERELQLENWEQVANDISGLGQELQCERLLNTPKDQLSYRQTQEVMGCAMGQAMRQLMQ